MKIILLFYFMIIFSISTLYSQTIENNIGRLTNNSYQIWRWEENEETMGNDCNVKYLLYTFFESPRIGYKEECINNSISEEGFTWEIIKDSKYNYLIYLYLNDTQVYEIDFMYREDKEEKNKKLIMCLARIKDTESKQTDIKKCDFFLRQ